MSALPFKFPNSLLAGILLFLLGTGSSMASTDPPFFTKEAEHWADSVLFTLSPSEKAAQLFMVAAWSNKDSAHIREITDLVSNWHIGGLIFFQGGPVRQAALTNNYQSVSKVPLMIGIDGEWGLAMRLDSTIRFPRQMTLTANPDDSSVYRMGQEIARQCRRLGIHVNFAPVADVNSNPLNPIIGSRSFGDERNTVARRSELYMSALQDNGVLASGKHFPGHGDADVDSHLDLPVIRHSRQEIDSVEFYPFRKLAEKGLGSVMVAHLNVPALDSTPELPSTLSKPIVTDLLKGELGFKGLIFTDALNMKAVSKNYPPGILERLALLAGNDVLLYSADVPKAINLILQAVDSGEISQQDIDLRVKKLLMAKYWCGLSSYAPIDTVRLSDDLNSSQARFLQQELYESSVTVVRADKGLLPLTALQKVHVAMVSIGAPTSNDFQRVLADHVRADRFTIPKDAPQSEFDAMLTFLGNFDLVILSLHGTNMRAQNGYGITDATAGFIDAVLSSRRTVFVCFGNPYSLSRISRLDKAAGVVLGYEDFQVPMVAAAQLLAGASTTEARLPVRVNDKLTAGIGLSSTKMLRLRRTMPEELGIPSSRFAALDSIASAAIAQGAMPGCQILVAKEGRVIYEKAFGYQTWDSVRAVRTDDLYDVASITKVASTALAVMKGYDSGKFKLHKPLSDYLHSMGKTDMEDLRVVDVLTHQAGLEPWIPFWKKTFSEGSFIRGIYSEIKSDDFPYRVCDSMYLRKDYKDSLMNWIYTSQLSGRGKYVYSDLGPILLRWAVEHVSGQPFENYLDQAFYAPLQLGNSGFRPYEKFPLDRIVPTENDTVFRHRLLRGDVHDPSAAMLGGVSGNAGLFSDAFDLAVVFQMLLKHGWYAGEQLISPNTVSLFTDKPLSGVRSRRGLLFDKPEQDPKVPGPTCAEACPFTFGHMGYTGTCVWADPARELIFVFLSNRVHPTASNEKLVKLRIRPALQKAAYDAVAGN